MNFIRYADDFIVTARTKEKLEEEIIPYIQKFLAERGLKLSKEKTKITHIDDGFDFLGQTIRKYNGKLIIKPSKKSVLKFLEAIRKFVKDNKTATQNGLIRALNPKIGGWCQYHRHVASKKTFVKIRHELWKACWQWAKSRHTTKSKQWIKDKYFIHNGRSDWNFSAVSINPTGKKERYTLLNAAHVRIIQHKQIKSDCNPYDPEWFQYLQKRNCELTAIGMKNKEVKRLWKSQGMVCPICKQLITLETDLDVHHIVKKSEGGTDEPSNLTLLHLNCHKQIHHAKKEDL